jgi:hypothetical protein
MIDNPTENLVEKLLNYRENYLDECIYLGSISIKMYEEYQQIADEASAENKLAQYLPNFSLALLDNLGAHGVIEYSVKKELLSKD